MKNGQKMMIEPDIDVTVGIDCVTVKDTSGKEVTISFDAIKDILLIINYEEIMRQATINLERKNDNS